MDCFLVFMLITCYLKDLFRGLFKLLYEKLDKLVRQCQAVNSLLQITETCKYDIQAVTNQILMIENPES